MFLCEELFDYFYEDSKKWKACVIVQLAMYTSVHIDSDGSRVQYFCIRIYSVSFLKQVQKNRFSPD